MKKSKETLFTQHRLIVCSVDHIMGKHTSFGVLLLNGLLVFLQTDQKTTPSIRFVLPEMVDHKEIRSLCTRFLETQKKGSYDTQSHFSSNQERKEKRYEIQHLALSNYEQNLSPT